MKQVLALILVCSTTLGFSQSSFGVYFKGYKPMGDFRQNVKTIPLGLGMDYFYHPHGSRFTIGAELGAAMYADFTYNGTIPSGQTVSLYEEDCFWTAHAEGRYHFFQSPSAKVYLQARMGFTTFFSTIDSEDEQVNFHQGKTHGTAFNTGVGAGVLLNWKKLFTGAAEPGSVNLDFGIGVHNGTSSPYRYVQRDQSIPIDQGKYHTLTDYMDMHLGVVFGPRWK